VTLPIAGAVLGPLPHEGVHEVGTLVNGLGRNGHDVEAEL
jgi:hypothetical protein